jgi:hypothetical protein
MSTKSYEGGTSMTEKAHLEQTIAHLTRLEELALQDRHHERARFLEMAVETYEAELARLDTDPSLILTPTPHSASDRMQRTSRVRTCPL